MKTKLFISRLRAVTEVAAQLFVGLMLISLIINGCHVVQYSLFRFWPIGAGIILAYTVLSLTEDYLNKRILCRYPQFT